MIIYKIQESGKATDFQNAKKCPRGWLSFAGDDIPEDKSKYNTDEYNKYLLIFDQKKECISLLNVSECKISPDPPYPADIAKWKTYRKALRVVLKSDKITPIPDKPF